MAEFHSRIKVLEEIIDSIVARHLNRTEIHADNYNELEIQVRNINKKLDTALESGTTVAFHGIYHKTINDRIANICKAIGMDLNGIISEEINNNTELTRTFNKKRVNEIKNICKILRAVVDWTEVQKLKELINNKDGEKTVEAETRMESSDNFKGSTQSDSKPSCVDITDFTLGQIRDKPYKFKQCCKCNAYNWYANKHCNNCNYGVFKSVDINALVMEHDKCKKKIISFDLESFTDFFYTLEIGYYFNKETGNIESDDINNGTRLKGKIK